MTIVMDRPNMAGLLQGKTGGASRGWALEVGGGRAALDGKPVEGYFSQITGESGGFPQGHISDIYIYIYQGCLT